MYCKGLLLAQYLASSRPVLGLLQVLVLFNGKRQYVGSRIMSGCTVCVSSNQSRYYTLKPTISFVCSFPNGQVIVLCIF